MNCAEASPSPRQASDLLLVEGGPVHVAWQEMTWSVLGVRGVARSLSIRGTLCLPCRPPPASLSQSNTRKRKRERSQLSCVLFEPSRLPRDQGSTLAKRPTQDLPHQRSASLGPPSPGEVCCWGSAETAPTHIRTRVVRLDECGRVLGAPCAENLGLRGLDCVPVGSTRRACAWRALGLPDLCQ